jgi:hypothetical protein
LRRSCATRSPAFAHRALPGPVDVEQIPALVDRGRHRFRASLELYDAELGDKPFFCGDGVTLADIDHAGGYGSGGLGQGDRSRITVSTCMRGWRTPLALEADDQ